jgi:hypothetical protein
MRAADSFCSTTTYAIIGVQLRISLRNQRVSRATQGTFVSQEFYPGYVYNTGFWERYVAANMATQPDKSGRPKIQKIVPSGEECRVT